MKGSLIFMLALVCGFSVFALCKGTAMRSEENAVYAAYEAINNAMIAKDRVDGERAVMSVTHTLTAKVYGIRGAWTLSGNSVYEKRGGIWVRVNN